MSCGKFTSVRLEMGGRNGPDDPLGKGETLQGLTARAQILGVSPLSVRDFLHSGKK